MAKKAQQLRASLMRAVSASDLKAVVRKLIDQAKDGDTTAAKIILDRVLGPPEAIDWLKRLEQLEICMGVQRQ